MLEPVVEAATVAGATLPELIVQACAAVAAVAIAIHGVLKGLREWREGSIRKVEGMHVVPSDRIEGKLDMLIDTVNTLSEDQKEHRSKTNMRLEKLSDRITRLEERAQLARAR